MRVIAHYRPKRKKPYEARWYVNCRLKSRFFSTEKERNRFISDFSGEISRHGDEVFKFDKKRMRRWQEVDHLVHDVDPEDIIKFWLEHHDPQGKKSLNMAVAAYENYLARSNLTPEYRSSVKKALSRFCSLHGQQPLRAISGSQITDFIESIPLSAVTKRHNRTALASAFKWFLKQDWIDKNPVAAVPIPKVTLKEPGILTLNEAQKLFHSNERVDPDICALLALGAFAGMRSSAIVRVIREEIDFSNRAILTPANKTKKSRRHYIEGLPDNLWAWLALASDAAFTMQPRTFAFRREKAFERAGLMVTTQKAKTARTKPKAPPHNCLRHSFVSYHVALHRNPGKTALLISHKNQNILWDHYLGVAKQEDAQAYFSIIPE